MRLTIITVNLNNREGLHKTAESVLKQNFRNFEYIIVDGASVDGSIEEIKKIDNPDIQQFMAISEPDSGIYEAMNKGIRAASGEYLLFLNSGDFLVDENVLKQVFRNNHSADFLLGRCNVTENGRVIWTSNPPEYVTFGFLYTQGLAHQSTFIKREMFLKYGFYNEAFRYNADIEFWYRTIILHGASTERLPIVISDYNKHGLSQTEKDTQTYQSEIALILSNPGFQKFIPDYDAWRKEKAEMEPYYWARSKPLLKILITSSFDLVRFFNKLKN